MKENKSIFYYLTQTMVVFAFTILILNLLAVFVGEDAKQVSSIFSLGSAGISAETALQFLLSSAILTGLRFLFFSDAVDLKMPLWLRCLCMLGSALMVLAVFILVFRWFPANELPYWALFLLCFLLSCAGSVLMVVLKEKAENRQMEKALRRFQEGDKK